MEKYSARAIDELGRIVLHSEIRKELGWDFEDKIEVYLVDANTVILQKKVSNKQNKDEAIIFSGSD